MERDQSACRSRLRGSGSSRWPSAGDGAPPAGKGLREKLERYAAYVAQLSVKGPIAAQHEVDRLLSTLRSPDPANLPKTLNRDSLDGVVTLLRSQGDGQSAAEIAQALGTSRITARRYLEHLADVGLVSRHSRYGGVGRPEVEYRWAD